MYYINANKLYFPVMCLVSRWSSHLSAGGSVVISSMKWDSCRLNILEPGTPSTTLCFIKLQRYKLTSANCLQKPSILLLLLTLRSLFQPPAAPPMFNSLPSPSAVTSDPRPARRAAWCSDHCLTTQRKVQTHQWLTDLIISQKSQCCYCWLFKLLQIQFSIIQIK